MTFFVLLDTRNFPLLVMFHIKVIRLYHVFFLTNLIKIHFRTNTVISRVSGQDCDSSFTYHYGKG